MSSSETEADGDVEDDRLDQLPVLADQIVIERGHDLVPAHVKRVLDPDTEEEQVLRLLYLRRSGGLGRLTVLLGLA